jgi:hypothetical protein
VATGARIVGGGRVAVLLLAMTTAGGGVAWGTDPSPGAPTSPTPTTPPSPPAGSPAPSPLAAGTEQPDVPIPDELFSAPADPLTLALTPATKGASAATIGSDGGTLSAKSADGTVYSLSVPAGALALPTLITMTPLTSVTGFPEGTVPAGTIGVQLEPEGLELALAATLTMQPKTAPPELDSGMLSAEAGGTEAGFEDYAMDGSGVQVQLDHFSSYFMVWPLPISEAQAIERQARTDYEARFAAVIASYLRYIQQAELRGEKPFYTRDQIAEIVWQIYERDILKPRLDAAKEGCLQAEDAIRALIAYGRTLVLNGWASDQIPTVDYFEDTGWVPKDLFDLQVRLCFGEAYNWCAESGDFPGLVAYYLDAFTRAEQFFGINPSDDWVALAIGYLKRCGRWRFDLSTSLDEVSTAQNWDRSLDTSREFYLQWQPGTAGFWGIAGGTIKGNGDVNVDKLESEAGGCSAPVVVSSIDSPVPADAEVTAMTMYQYTTPLLGIQLRAAPPLLTDLSIYVTFGKVTWTEYQGCGVPRADHSDTFYVQAYIVDPNPDRKDLIQRLRDFGAGDAAQVGLFDRKPYGRRPPLHVPGQPPQRGPGAPSRWEYHTGPLSATMSVKDDVVLSKGFVDHVTMEAIFTHDPT